MSWTPTDEQVEKAARALAYNMTNGLVTEVEDQDRDVARAVLVAVGPHIAAQALRDAAGDARHRWGVKPDPSDWLTDRADTIEKEAGR